MPESAKDIHRRLVVDKLSPLISCTSRLEVPAFHIGSQVLVRKFPGARTAFGEVWTAQHPIVAVHGNGTYEVDHNEGQVNLRPWNNRELLEYPPVDHLTRRPPVHVPRKESCP